MKKILFEETELKQEDFKKYTIELFDSAKKIYNNGSCGAFIACQKCFAGQHNSNDNNYSCSNYKNTKDHARQYMILFSKYNNLGAINESK